MVVVVVACIGYVALLPMDFGARSWTLRRFGSRFIRENGRRQAAHSNRFDRRSLEGVFMSSLAVEALDNQGLGESCIHHSSMAVDTIISSALRENTIEGYASLLKYIKANHSKTRHVTRIDLPALSEMDFALDEIFQQIQGYIAINAILRYEEKWGAEELTWIT